MQEILVSNPVYGTMAFGGTLLFLVKMIMLLVSGGDMDVDGDLTEIDSGVDMDGGTTFSLISIQSVLAFFMGAGWTGLAARHEWNLEAIPAMGAAIGVGFIFMFISAYFTFKVKGLNASTVIDVREAIGKTGRTYTTIPALGEGIGQIEITIGGKQQILQAMSLGEKIESFTTVKVEKVDDAGTLHVLKV